MDRVRPLTILEFTIDDAISYTQVRATLERGGTPIGPLTTPIAAQATRRTLTLEQGAICGSSKRSCGQCQIEKVSTARNIWAFDNRKQLIFIIF